MIALDTNLLVYAFRRDSPRHEVAAQALAARINSGRPTGVPWPCVHEFLAVVTNARAFTEPSEVEEAITAMETLMAQPNVHGLTETGRHLLTLSGLMRAGKVRGPRVHEARIAAICLDHGVESLWTADRDFGYFPALRTHNPLVTTEY